MSEIIFKYQLSCVPEQTLMLPFNAKILCVQMQSDTITLWASHDLNLEESIGKEPRTIALYGTGELVTDCLPNKYLGTVQRRGLVWHLYERRAPNTEWTPDEYNRIA
jgi:hypothetical protein